VEWAEGTAAARVVKEAVREAAVWVKAVVVVEAWAAAANLEDTQ
jgi:hypothetical protein